MSVKTHLVIHHSATRDSKSVSWSAIRRFHTEANGWRAIGYQLGIEDVGGHYEMLAGRPLLARAAGEPRKGANQWGIHVCFVGDFDTTTPGEGLYRFAAPHLADLLRLMHPYGFDTRKHVIGHRDLRNDGKTCPGTHFDLGRLRSHIDGVL